MVPLKISCSFSSPIVFLDIGSLGAFDRKLGLTGKDVRQEMVLEKNVYALRQNSYTY